MKTVYEYAVVNDDGAFVLSGDYRLHIYGSKRAAELFMDGYTGREDLFLRRIRVESLWKLKRPTRRKSAA